MSLEVMPCVSDISAGLYLFDMHVVFLRRCFFCLIFISRLALASALKSYRVEIIFGGGMDVSLLWKATLWVVCGFWCSRDREPAVVYEQGTCNLYGQEERELVARFNVTERDCKKIGFSGRRVIDFRLDYPGGTLSDRHRLTESDVIFVMVGLNDAPVHPRGKLGLGIDYCPPGGNSYAVDSWSCFVDGNGIPVVVTEYFKSYGAQKYYNGDRINYLVGKKMQDFESVDIAVIAFLDRYYVRSEK